MIVVCLFGWKEILKKTVICKLSHYLLLKQQQVIILKKIKIISQLTQAQNDSSKKRQGTY